MKKILLIFLTIIVGIVIGFQLEKSATPPQVDISNKIISTTKEIHIPQYLSQQRINYKDEYRKNRPTPTTKEEKIIAYYEDIQAQQYEKSSEVYEENGTVYLNLDGKIKALASNDGNKTVMMLPKLSASKRYISYTQCKKEENSCLLVVKNLITDDEVVLEDVGTVYWHPTDDMLIYDVVEDDGENLTKGELYLYYPERYTKVELTNSSNFVENRPIFSKDGYSVYCDDAKTGKLLYFPLFSYSRESYISAIKLYKTADKNMSIEEIKKHSKLFEPIEKDEKFCDKEMNYWIRWELKDDVKSGTYISDTHPFLFDKNSFNAKQLDVNRTKLRLSTPIDNPYHTVFKYERGVDERVYYFRLNSYELSTPFFRGIYELKAIENMVKDRAEVERTYYFYKTGLMHTILSAIVVGMILMSALYTMVMYVYRRQKEFLYYTLMQVSMAFFLLTAPMFFRDLFHIDFLSMPQLSLLVAFFATLFTQAFLETKKHLPTMNTILNLYLILLIADMIWIYDPIFLKYKLYGIFGLLYLVIAFLRAKDGFVPAWFYLLGWIVLLGAIASMDFFHMSDFMMFVGVFFEAIFLAWGLVYRSGFFGRGR